MGELQRRERREEGNLRVEDKISKEDNKMDLKNQLLWMKQVGDRSQGSLT